MQYNECKVCGAGGGRAGNLWSHPSKGIVDACQNCSDSLLTGNISVHVGLQRTPQELERMAAAVDVRFGWKKKVDPKSDKLLAEAQSICEEIRDQGCEMTAGAAACAEAIQQYRIGQAVTNVLTETKFGDETPHKDISGRVIRIGDSVATTERGYTHSLVIRKVTGFTAKKIKLGMAQKFPEQLCVVVK